MQPEEKKAKAEAWFRSLRDRICTEFESIEEGIGDWGLGIGDSTPQSPKPKAQSPRFQRKQWQREGGGGGEMSVMKGRVFEKVGVNISTVHGEFSESFRKEIPGAAEDPRFWASGISLVAHMASPLVPAVHMNTRMIVVGDNAKLWFGGGADLTPALPDAKDTADFHAALKAACDRFDAGYYATFKKGCDEYFFIKHRNETRGVGGIFYDQLNSGEWEKDFAFTQEVGEAFLQIYPVLVKRHMDKKWTPEQKRAQLIKRGRYAEFNLLYDRGTRFGLMTGGNPEAILMSLPPEAVWE